MPSALRAGQETRRSELTFGRLARAKGHDERGQLVSRLRGLRQPLEYHDHGKQALAVSGTLMFVRTAAICSVTEAAT